MQADWERAREAVRDELAQRGHRLEHEKANALDLSDRTWRNFDKGSTYRPRGDTQAVIEQALGWPSRTLERIAQGGEPPKTEAGERAELRAAIPSATDEEVEVVWEALQAHRAKRRKAEGKDSPSEGSQRRIEGV